MEAWMGSVPEGNVVEDLRRGDVEAANAKLAYIANGIRSAANAAAERGRHATAFCLRLQAFRIDGLHDPAPPRSPR